MLNAAEVRAALRGETREPGALVRKSLRVPPETDAPASRVALSPDLIRKRRAARKHWALDAVRKRSDARELRKIAEMVAPLLPAPKVNIHLDDGAEISDI